MKRMAILEIHPQAFRDLLQLPEGAEISDLRLNIDRRGVLEVKIDGAGWEVREGECLMRTTGTVTTDENGRRCIDWGMPSNSLSDPTSSSAIAAEKVIQCSRNVDISRPCRLVGRL